MQIRIDYEFELSAVFAYVAFFEIEHGIWFH